MYMADYCILKGVQGLFCYIYYKYFGIPTYTLCFQHLRQKGIAR